MMMKIPDKYDPGDVNYYAQILKGTGAMYRGNAVHTETSKATKSYKQGNIVKQLFIASNSGYITVVHNEIVDRKCKNVPFVVKFRVDFPV